MYSRTDVPSKVVAMCVQTFSGSCVVPRVSQFPVVFTMPMFGRLVSVLAYIV